MAGQEEPDEHGGRHHHEWEGNSEGGEEQGEGWDCNIVTGPE